MTTFKKHLTFKSSIVLGLVLATSVLTSCNNDDDIPEVTSKTIVQLVVEDPNFSFLEAAVVKADLVAALSADGPFTVFAPTNDAFIAAGFANEAEVSAASKETLTAILTYHVLESNTLAADIPTATNTQIETMNTASVFVTKNNNGVFVNGSTVLQADVRASNGVIHVINKVLMPATGNIVEAAQGNPNLSFLVAAVLKADLATTLSGTGPFTVFAPTNDAFIAAGFASEAAVTAATKEVLTPILTYHVVSGRVFSTDLTDGATPATVNGANVTITLTGGAKVKGIGNSTAENIAITNMVTTNGVV
ncbi:MAG TPA: fasciclin domain-containing protein, partial [Pelobium sp.]|nr:fasciclin domain-containing protein [Pelobium sp.]